MMSLFFSLPWFISGFLFVIGFILITLLGLLFVRYTIHPQILEVNHELGAVAFNIVGLIYAVLLGFTVLNAQDRFNEVHQTIENEANLVADLFRDAAAFDPDEQESARSALRAYAISVVKDEWPMLAEEKLDKRMSKVFQSVWHAYYDIDPQTDQQRAWYAASISRLNELNNARLVRFYNTQESLGPMMWTLLIVGAMITTSFSYFFYCGNLKAQILMTSMIAGSVSFMLFLTLSLDHPFLGDQGIHPIAFERVLDLFEEWEK